MHKICTSACSLYLSSLILRSIFGLDSICSRVSSFQNSTEGRIRRISNLSLWLSDPEPKLAALRSTLFQCIRDIGSPRSLLHYVFQAQMLPKSFWCVYVRGLSQKRSPPLKRWKYRNCSVRRIYECPPVFLPFSLPVIDRHLKIACARSLARHRSRGLQTSGKMLLGSNEKKSLFFNANGANIVSFTRSA